MKSASPRPVTVYDAAFLILFGLKVAGKFGGSWWLVFSPIYLEFALNVLAMLVAIIWRRK